MPHICPPKGTCSILCFRLQVSCLLLNLYHVICLSTGTSVEQTISLLFTTINPTSSTTSNTLIICGMNEERSHEVLEILNWGGWSTGFRVYYWNRLVIPYLSSRSQVPLKSNENCESSLQRNVCRQHFKDINIFTGFKGILKSIDHPPQFKIPQASWFLSSFIPEIIKDRTLYGMLSI